MQINGKVNHNRIFNKSVEFDLILDDGEEMGEFFKILHKKLRSTDGYTDGVCFEFFMTKG